jgi:hypothetical protein
LETRANAIVSNLEKRDAPASSRSGTGSVECKKETFFFSACLKFISETCPLLGQKGDTHSYCASLIMQAKEMRVSRGVSPFLTKAGVSPILSPIMKARTSPFIMKASASPISYIEDER